MQFGKAAFYLQKVTLSRLKPHATKNLSLRDHTEFLMQNAGMPRECIRQFKMYK